MEFSSDISLAGLYVAMLTVSLKLEKSEEGEGAEFTSPMHDKTAGAGLSF